MACGLISADGNVVPLKNIECKAEVTGDFGLYTLKQHYYNDCDTPLCVRYIFPIPSGGAVIQFTAEIGDRQIKSVIMDRQSAKKIANEKQSTAILTKHRNGALEAYIGMIPPSSNIVISVKYISISPMEDNAIRLIIPTVIAPRYVSYGSQLALESVMLDEVKYKISLDMTYRGKDIDDIKSPSHDIEVEIDSYGANVRLAKESSADRDIIIDINLLGKNRPVMYYHNDIAYYSFTPKIDVYRRIPREYVFMLDVSGSMAGEKLNQAKTALLICLRCLQEGDSFNIIAFQTMYQTFRDASVPFNEESLKEAKRWITSLCADGGTELLRPVLKVCESENCTALLFTDGHIANYEDILTYVQGRNGIVFYTFGIDSAVNGEFLTKLAGMSGGTSKFIAVTERIDEAIIRAFNKIAAPTIKNAVVTFDCPALNITPKVFKQIHAGQRLSIMAKFMGNPPKKLTVTGEFSHIKCVMQVQFEHPTAAGSELLYYYAKGQIDSLKLQLTGEETRDELIKSQITALSVNHGLLTEETAFVLSYGGEDNHEEVVVDVIVPQSIPAFWEMPTGIMRETVKRKTKTDEYLKIMKTQRANGSFSKAKMNTVDYSANILYQICTECEKADLFIWQLRKCAAYLLDSIQKSNNAVIPERVIDALEAWHSKFGANDEISQKVMALTFMYRKY